MAKKGLSDDWLDNSYGIDKYDYDNEIDYLDAIDNAIAEMEEEEEEMLDDFFLFFEEEEDDDLF